MYRIYLNNQLGTLIARESGGVQSASVEIISDFIQNSVSFSVDNIGVFVIKWVVVSLSPGEFVIATTHGKS